MLSNYVVKPETYINKADEAIAAEEWQKAIKYLLRVIKKLHSKPPASTYVKLVRCYRKESLFDKARVATQKGLSVYPDSQSLLIEEAEIAMDQADWKTAAKNWENIEQQFKDKTPLAVHIRLGRALRLDGKLTEAKSIVQKQMVQNKDSLDLLVELAEISTAEKNWKAAYKYWQQALAKVNDSDQGMKQYVRLNVSVTKRLADLTGYKKMINKYQQNKNKIDRKIAIVTSVTKGYDPIMPHEFIDDRFDYFMYTDAKFNDLGFYEIRPLPYPELDGPRAIRYIKTHPHTLFSDYDVVVWLDTSLMIVGDIYPLIKKFQASGLPIGSGVHPLRKNIYEEFDACVAAKKADYKVMKRQMDFYKKAGYKSTELSENGMLMFNLKQDGVAPAMETWWDQICKFSSRDQLSFNYSLETNGARWFHLTEPPRNIRNHPDFVIIGHNTKYPALDELYAMLD